MSNGANPLRWNCDNRGCFNIKKRPKIEMFADCFPGKISMGDIDGAVEINGKLLILEWKEDRGGLRQGQEIMFENLSKHGNVSVMIVEGCPETMQVSRVAIYHGGKFSPWKEATLEDIKCRMRGWAEWARVRWTESPGTP